MINYNIYKCNMTISLNKLLILHATTYLGTFTTNQVEYNLGLEQISDYPDIYP